MYRLLRKINTRHFARVFAWACVFLMCFSIFFQLRTSALSQAQLNQFINKVYYYDVDECGTDNGDSSDIEAGEGSPTGASFPNLDPASMANSINKWIKKTNSKSKMNGLGDTIVASAKESNVNPFLIVVIARKESGLSSPSDYNVSNGNNSFGRKASSSQPSFPGSGPSAGVNWYKWSSVKASVDHTASENKNIKGGGDMASYLRNQYGDQIKKNDISALMMEYAPPGENDTETYIKEIKGWTKELVRLTKKGGASTSTSSSGASSSNSTGSGSSISNTSRIYMNGDSITVGAYYETKELKKAFQKEQWQSQVDASGARGMTYAGSNPKGNLPGVNKSGLESLKADKNAIKNSDTVIIALGTNASTSVKAFGSEVKDAIKTINNANGSAEIYWVNIMTTKSPKATRDYNEKLEDLSGSLNFKIIDVKGANIPLADQIHPDSGGYKKWSKTIVDGINNSSDSSQSSSENNNCTCGPKQSDTLSGKNNEEKIWNFFKGKGLEDHIVAGIMGNISQESGFNPDLHQDGGPAYGLIQWDPVYGIALEDWLKKAGIDGDKSKLETQLELVWWHLKNLTPRSFKNGLKGIKKAKNVKEATDAWEYQMEGAGTPMMENRYAAAKVAMKKYGGSSVSGSSTTSDSSSCTCEQPTGQTVVLDPGHSGSDIVENKDPSGIISSDYYNRNETENMWAVSQKITKKLKSEGYKVINTKKSAKDTVGLIERARIANNANAAIAVSLHSTSGKFGSKAAGWVIPQEKGLYRQSGTKKKTFSDAGVAKKSQNYADKILEARKKSEGDAQIHKLNFQGRGLPATGNISIVQLFSKVPWVYNEVGQTGFNANKYASGIAQGIINALGNSGSESSSKCTGGSGDISSIVKSYAWPNYSSSRSDPKPEYKKAYDKAVSNGQYGGGGYTDCGAFVTRVMIDSGYDPNYNFKGTGGATGGSPSASGSQWNWLDKNWKKINVSSTKDLKPGDVAIHSTHTYMYTGKIDGMDDVAASASLGGRVPMTSSYYEDGFTWYRKE